MTVARRLQRRRRRAIGCLGYSSAQGVSASAAPHSSSPSPRYRRPVPYDPGRPLRAQSGSPPREGRPQENPFASRLSNQQCEWQRNPEAETIEAAENATPDPCSHRFSQPRKPSPRPILSHEQVSHAPDAQECEQEPVVIHAAAFLPFSAVPARERG